MATEDFWFPKSAQRHVTVTDYSARCFNIHHKSREIYHKCPNHRSDYVHASKTSVLARDPQYCLHIHGILHSPDPPIPLHSNVYRTTPNSSMIRPTSQTRKQRCKFQFIHTVECSMQIWKLKNLVHTIKSVSCSYEYDFDFGSGFGGEGQGR